MASDYIIEMQEQEIEEQRERNIMYNAAIFVAKGGTRENSKKQAMELDFLQREAERASEVIMVGNDETIEGYLDSNLNNPKKGDLKESQISAIYLKLCEEEDISPE